MKALGRLVITNKQSKVPFNFSQIKRQAGRLQQILELQEVNLVIKFGSDSLVQKLNEETRGIDKPTDVISIPYMFLEPGTKPKPQKQNRDLGQIVLGMGYIQRKALTEQRDIDTIITRTVVHGLCHLLGYTHRQEHDSSQMAEKEDQVLELLQQSEQE